MRQGRSLPQLAADFGHRLPTRTPRPRRPDEPELFAAPTGRHGRPGPAAGWAAVPAPLVLYRMTSGQIGGVWPLIPAADLPATGAVLGIDYLSGGAFHVDPIGWTLAGTAGVTNPNVMIFGAPGRGKSATVKMLVLRMLAYGYRTLVLGDVKDEYAPLCHALGVAPHTLGPGLPGRINPLDFGPLGTDWAHLDRAETQRRAGIIFARWLVLLRGLIGALGVPFTPTAETALGACLRSLTGHSSGNGRLRPLTLPLLWQALADPPEDLIRDCRYAGRRHWLDDTRPIRDALGALVHGHLAGLFDADSTIDVDWCAPIQSLSLSRLTPLGDEAVGIALICLNSWGRAMTALTEPGQPRIIVRDECWKQMRLGVEAVKSLDADLRLSRADGCIQIVIAHKPSDLLTVGDAGSQAVAIAKDLLHLCATRVLAGQDEQIGTQLADLLGLSPMAAGIITDWATAGKGRALWLVGNRAAKVQTLRTAVDIALTETNSALTGRR